jgi:DNA-binding CsgD family transcriptional regulator
VSVTPESTRQPRLPDCFTSGEWQTLTRRFGLARRQAQIARWICRGLSNPAIAKEIGVSPDTVRMHTRALYKKLDIAVRVGVPVRLLVAHRAILQEEDTCKR